MGGSKKIEAGDTDVMNIEWDFMEFEEDKDDNEEKKTKSNRRLIRQINRW